MTILLSYPGSTPSHDLSMPSTGFDYVSKFAVNIDMFLLYVDRIDRMDLVFRRRREVAYGGRHTQLTARDLEERIGTEGIPDWAQKEPASTDMHRTIRRLLTKYGYPPDAQEGAAQLVIRQAELMAEGLVS
jgi:hypothetical protein